MLELRLSHTWREPRLNVSQVKITGIRRETKFKVEDSLELEPGAVQYFWTPDTYLK